MHERRACLVLDVPLLDLVLDFFAGFVLGAGELFHLNSFLLVLFLLMGLVDLRQLDKDVLQCRHGNTVPEQIFCIAAAALLFGMPVFGVLFFVMVVMVFRVLFTLGAVGFFSVLLPSCLVFILGDLVEVLKQLWELGRLFGGDAEVHLA